MDSSGHTDISDVRASASGSNDVFGGDLGLPAKPDALGKISRTCREMRGAILI